MPFALVYPELPDPSKHSSSPVSSDLACPVRDWPFFSQHSGSALGQPGLVAGSGARPACLGIRHGAGRASLWVGWRRPSTCRAFHGRSFQLQPVLLEPCVLYCGWRVGHRLSLPPPTYTHISAGAAPQPIHHTHLHVFYQNAVGARPRAASD